MGVPVKKLDIILRSSARLFEDQDGHVFLPRRAPSVGDRFVEVEVLTGGYPELESFDRGLGPCQHDDTGDYRERSDDEKPGREPVEDFLEFGRRHELRSCNRGRADPGRIEYGSENGFDQSLPAARRPGGGLRDLVVRQP